MLGRGTRRALIIEDDANTRVALKRSLARLGYEAEASAHLDSAIGAGLTDDYSLITLDLRLGNGTADGEAVAQMLKDHGITTPVLVVSAYLDDDARARMRSMGVQHFLEKPFTVTDFLNSTRRATKTSAA